MNKYLFIFLIMFASITLVTAMTVGYLSNNSRVEVSVESPLTATSKLNSEIIYGGETINYKASVVNNINKTINGILTLTISNNKASASCNDFELITLNSVVPALVPTTFSCLDDGMGLVTITKGVTYSPLEEETYLGTFGLKVNVEPAVYQINTQVMNLA